MQRVVTFYEWREMCVLYDEKDPHPRNGATYKTRGRRGGRFAKKKIYIIWTEDFQKFTLPEQDPNSTRKFNQFRARDQKTNKFHMIYVELKKPEKDKPVPEWLRTALANEEVTEERITLDHLFNLYKSQKIRHYENFYKLFESFTVSIDVEKQLTNHDAFQDLEMNDQAFSLCVKWRLDDEGNLRSFRGLRQLHKMTRIKMEKKTLMRTSGIWRRS